MEVDVGMFLRDSTISMVERNKPNKGTILQQQGGLKGMEAQTDTQTDKKMYKKMIQ